MDDTWREFMDEVGGCTSPRLQPRGWRRAQADEQNTQAGAQSKVRWRPRFYHEQEDKRSSRGYRDWFRIASTTSFYIETFW
jgi:hypothetical protein